MIVFAVGQTYQVRSLGDWDCIFSFEVTARNNSFVWVLDGDTTYKRKVTVREGVETLKPFGTYSLAPTLRADRQGA